MDRKTLTGLVLIFLIVIGYSWYSQRIGARQRMLDNSQSVGHAMMVSLFAQDTLTKSGLVTVRETDQGSQAAQDAGPEDSDSLISTETDSNALFPQALHGTERLITLENELLKVTLSNRGGKVSSVQVKGYRTFDHDSLILFKDGYASFGLSFLKNKEQRFASDSLFYDVSDTSFSVSGEEERTISFSLRNDSVSIENRYTIKGNSPFIDFDIILNGVHEVSNKQPAMRLTWQTNLNQLEQDFDKAQTESEFVAYDIQDDISYIASTSKTTPAGEAGVPIKWFAHKHQFFASALVSKDSFARVSTDITEPDSGAYFKGYTTQVQLPFDTARTVNEYNMRIFFGPLKYKELKRDGLGMHLMIPMGSSLLGRINRGITYPVYRAFDGIFHNVAISILLLALFVKLILSPLTFRSYKSQAKMKVLRPEINELKAKFGKDPRRLQMETMKLYRKAGVSMFGGCIPTLLQFPVLIALYRFFPNIIDMRQQGFLWVEDMSTYDSIATLPFEIPFYGDHISLLTILMAISSFLYSRANQQMTSGMGAEQMKVLQYIFPFMLLFLFNKFPAGLTYYYFLTNMLTFVQQWLFKKFLIDEAAIRTKIEEHRARPEKEGRMARFQKRLEAAQRAQMEARRKQGKRR